MRSLITNQAGLTANRLDRIQLGDKRYAVAPVVALRPGVLNGELVAPEEVAANVEAWNGRPIPVYHPRGSDGAYISANTPGVATVGTIFNARIVGDDLVAEMWLDEDQVRANGGDGLVALERLDRGEVVEVSTAYFRDYETQPGTHGGKTYEGIARNLQPDHVALLPRDTGACSIVDGCGAGRSPSVNCQCHKETTMGENVTTAGAPAQAEQLEQELATNQVKPTTLPPPAQTEQAEQAEQAAQAEKAEQPTIAANSAVLSTFAQALAEMGGAQQVIAALRQVTGQAQAEKQAIVGRLAANSRAGFTAAELGDLPVDVLRKLDRALTPVDYSGQGGQNLTANTSEEWVPYTAPQAG